MSHAPRPPSAAHRWTLCPGSVRLEASIPDKPSEHSLRGTAAHRLLEMGLGGEVAIGGVMDGFLITLTPEETGLDEPVEIELTAEDIAAVNEAYTYILSKLNEDTLFWSEQKVNPGPLLGDREDVYGTADVILYQPATQELEVIDYKHGSGVLVNVENNPQLVLYGLGAHDMLVDAEPATVKLTIVQPRCFHPDGAVRSQDWPVDKLMEWVPWFKQALQLTDAPDPILNPGEDQCRFCRVRATCPALADKALKAAAAVMPDVSDGKGMAPDLTDKLVRDPSTLSPEELTYVLDHEKLIQGWLNAVHQHARDKLLRGEEVPGWKLVHGRSSRSWKDPEEVQKELQGKSFKDGKRITKKDLFTEQLISPAQAEKKLKPRRKPERWQQVEALIGKSEGKPVLAPVSDSRPAIARAEDVFTKVESDTGADLSFLT